MPEQRQVKLRLFLDDIRAGMTRPALMEKYGLTSRQLQRALIKLLESHIITRSDVPEKLPTQHATIAQENIRDLHRHRLDFSLPAYEADRPHLVGRIRDLSPEGVGLAGLNPTVGVVSTIVALGDDVGVISPFEFQAQCLWAKRDVSGDDRRSGFQIVAISETDRRELKKLIRIVAVGW